MKTHKDLVVWQNAITLVTEIYQVSKLFPKEELYGLTSQLRRSAVSIPSNISEGAARNHSKEFIHYLYISLGSIAELETQLIISINLGYIQEELWQEFEDKIKKIRVQLSGLIKAIRNNPKKPT
ncbi:MAG: four helix bundle protein [Deltaproteobacteria bacterium]|nr:four helix bundle protein [Deltaproteobacteria bacterium]